MSLRPIPVAAVPPASDVTSARMANCLNDFVGLKEAVQTPCSISAERMHRAIVGLEVADQARADLQVLSRDDAGVQGVQGES